MSAIFFLYYLRFLLDFSAIRLASSVGRLQPSFLATFVSTVTISSLDGADTRIPKQRDLMAGITYILNKFLTYYKTWDTLIFQIEE